jgi:UPF0755 protein
MTELFADLPGDVETQGGGRHAGAHRGPERRHLHLAPPGGVERRDPHRAHKHRRKARRRRSAVVLLVCLALLGAGGYAAYGWLRPVIDGLNAPTDYEGPGTGTVEVTIEQGASGRTIAQTLEDAGVVLTGDAFLQAAEAEPRAASIQPGTYALRGRMQASQALALLLDPAARVSIGVTVIEGRRAAEVFETVSADTGFGVEELTAAVADPAVGLPPEAGGDPEGYLFPATYSFDPEVTPVEILAAMVAKHTATMDAVGVPQAQRREILVRASLIQAEGRLPADLPRVSRVIQNRLEAGKPLQFDSTVNFANGTSGITTTDADRANPSPYNTYLYPGLPPGPINSPGEAAIAAALEPEPGNWLYFVAVNPDTGETRFAATDAEHAANVELFRQWLRENP